MDSRFCYLSNTMVTSGFCQSCSYFLKKYTVDEDNPFCGFVCNHPDVKPTDENFVSRFL